MQIETALEDKLPHALLTLVYSLVISVEN